MKMRMVFGIALGLLVASMSPVFAHDEEAKAPVIKESKKDSSDDQWYDFRKVAPPSEVGFDFHKELRLRVYGFETAKKKKGLDVSGRSLVGEISIRPWSWAFESPFTDEENRIEAGVYARYETHKLKSTHPERDRWYHNSLSLGLELTYVDFDEHGAVWMITVRPCAYLAEARGKSEDPSRTYELFYQNSAGFEISGIFEHYGLFCPLERGSRSGFFPALMFEGGYAEHRGEKLKSTLTKAHQIDEPHETTRYWLKASLWLFQYDFKGLLISIGGSAFGENTRAEHFRYPSIRHNSNIRTFSGGPSIRLFIADHLLFEATGFYGRSSPQSLDGNHHRGAEVGMAFRF